MRLLSKVIKVNQYPPIVSYYEIKKPEQPPEADCDSEEKENDSDIQVEKDPPVPEEKPVSPSLTDEQARRILEEAFAKAKQIVDSAQEYTTQQMQETRAKIEAETAETKRHGYDDGYAKGLEAGRKDGHAAGYRVGFEEGTQKAAADNRKNAEELGLMMETVEKSKTKILHDFQEDLQNLAVAMAKAILKKELEIDDDAIRSIILSAMEEYRNQEWVRIYVSDGTANILLKSDGSIVEALKDISDNVKVVVSPGLDEGGCILETPDQIVDAGIDSQLKKIKTAIESAMKNQAE